MEEQWSSTQKSRILAYRSLIGGTWDPQSERFIYPPPDDLTVVDSDILGDVKKRDGDILDDLELYLYLGRMRERLNFELNTFIYLRAKRKTRANPNPMTNIENEESNEEIAYSVAECAEEILLKYMELQIDKGNFKYTDGKLVTHVTKQIADFAFRLAKKLFWQITQY